MVTALVGLDLVGAGARRRRRVDRGPGAGPAHRRTTAAARVRPWCSATTRSSAAAASWSSRSSQGGQVRIGGELWTARPYDDDLVIEPGAQGRRLPDQGRHGTRARGPRARLQHRPGHRRPQESHRKAQKGVGDDRSTGAVGPGRAVRRGRARQDGADRAAGARRDRRAVREVQGEPAGGPEHRGAVRRQGALHDRPARAGGLVPAAAGDHRGQPGGLHRHRHLLPGHRPGRGDVRDRQLHPGRRAAHR